MVSGETYTYPPHCPQCGPTKVDEDGLCLNCGNGAVGEAIEQLQVELAALRAAAGGWRTGVPEADGLCMVTWRSGNCTHVTTLVWSDGAWWFEGGWKVPASKNVLAWQPLPAPYMPEVK